MEIDFKMLVVEVDCPRLITAELNVVEGRGETFLAE